MSIRVVRSSGALRGRIRVPGDKSISHRALLLNALARGRARVRGLLDSADIFASVGTSGQVYPAAAFVQQAREAGAHTIELNLDPSDIAHDFDEVRTGLASQVVPAWVDDMLAGAAGGQAAQADPERPVT